MSIQALAPSGEQINETAPLNALAPAGVVVQQVVVSTGFQAAWASGSNQVILGA